MMLSRNYQEGVHSLGCIRVCCLVTYFGTLYHVCVDKCRSNIYQRFLSAAFVDCILFSAECEFKWIDVPFTTEERLIIKLPLKSMHFCLLSLSSNSVCQQSIHFMFGSPHMNELSLIYITDATII